MCKRFRMSLRMRITLVTAITMTIICILLAVVIISNANIWIIEPLNSTESSMEVTDSHFDESASETVLVEDGRYYFTQFYIAAFICAGIVLMAGIVLIYFVIKFSLKPMKKFQNSISEIDSDISKRAEGFEAVTELDALAQSFNQMLDRIEAAFNREKDFSAGAAHELKTPLAVIGTNIDVLNLTESPTEDDYKETIEVVKKQTERMTRLVNDLFTMCALNEYETEESIYIDSLISESISEYTETAKQKNIGIEVSTQSCTLKGNTVMLKHAVSNLIQNAIRYNVENGIIKITGKVNDSNYEITVSDNGIGISPEAAEHIFEAFFREDKSRSRKNGGAGLGLSLARNIAEQHGGSICYYPNEPIGSVFIMSIPIN